MVKYAIEGNEVSEQEFCMMLNKPHDLVIDDKNSFRSIYPSTNNNFTFYGTYNDYEVTCENCINCIDCYHCVKCENCRSCVDCDRCNYCTNCRLCHECTYCIMCESCRKCNQCSSSLDSEYCEYCIYVEKIERSDFCKKCSDCVVSDNLEKCKLCINCKHAYSCIGCDNCEYCEYCDNCSGAYYAISSSRCSWCNFIDECCLCHECKFIKESCLCDNVNMSSKLLMANHSMYSCESSLLTNSEFCTKINNNVYDDDVKNVLKKVMNTYIKKIHIKIPDRIIDSVEWVIEPNTTLFSNSQDIKFIDYLPELFEYLFDKSSEILPEVEECVLPDFNSFATALKSKLNMICDKCYYCQQLTNTKNCKFCIDLTNCCECMLSRVFTDCNHCINSSLLEHCNDCYYTQNAANSSNCNFCKYIDTCNSISFLTAMYNNIDFNDKNLVKTTTNIAKYLNVNLVETNDCKCGCGRRVEVFKNPELQIYICYNKDNEISYIGTTHVGIIFQNYFDNCVVNDVNIVYKIGYFDNLNPFLYLSDNDSHTDVFDNVKFYGTMYNRSGSVVKHIC